jgi:hypothetical protein
VSLRGDTTDNLKLDTAVATKTVDTRLDPTPSYLLFGDLGLGRPVPRWLVEHNACRSICLSRSAGISTGPDDYEFG